MKVFFIIVVLSFSVCAKGQVPDTAGQKALTAGFYNAQRLSEKKTFYNKLVKNFPESSAAANGINYDELKRILALNYLMQDSIAQYKNYINSIKDKVMLAASLNNVASHWTNTKPQLEKAELLSALSVELTEGFIKSPARYKPVNMLVTDWQQQLLQQKNAFSYTYASILYKLGKNEQALKILQPIYENSQTADNQMAELYGHLLGLTGNPKKAVHVIETAMNNGYRSDSLVEDLRKYYQQVYGEKADFQNYHNGLLTNFKVKLRERFRQQMVNEKAPDFALKDRNGNVVTLKNLRGKTVVIDFWATWCKPCIESFPAMQLISNKYKNNNQVVFLFINTWENSKDYLAKVNKFLSTSKYTLNVLMDDADASGRQRKTASAFKIDALPTKIIIGPKGFIRFRDVGYSQSQNTTIENTLLMIELAAG